MATQRSRRANAGNRMAQLLKANVQLEADELFAEVENDAEFAAEERDDDDEFDSDFNSSESENETEESADAPAPGSADAQPEDDDRVKKKRPMFLSRLFRPKPKSADGSAASAASSLGGIPAAPKPKSKRTGFVPMPIEIREQSYRKSTLRVKQDVQQRIQQRNEERRPRRRKQTVVQLTQEELMAEAARTAEANIASLEYWRNEEEVRKEKMRRSTKPKVIAGPVISLLSTSRSPFIVEVVTPAEPMAVDRGSTTTDPEPTPVAARPVEATASSSLVSALSSDSLNVEVPRQVLPSIAAALADPVSSPTRVVPAVPPPPLSPRSAVPPPSIVTTKTPAAAAAPALPQPPAAPAATTLLSFRGCNPADVMFPTSAAAAAGEDRPWSFHKIPICPITGGHGKYRDPQTLVPYATGAAFRAIRAIRDEGKLLEWDQTARTWAPEPVDDPTGGQYAAVLGTIVRVVNGSDANWQLCALGLTAEDVAAPAAPATVATRLPVPASVVPLPLVPTAPAPAAPLAFTSELSTCSGSSSPAPPLTAAALLGSDAAGLTASSDASEQSTPSMLASIGRPRAKRTRPKVPKQTESATASGVKSLPGELSEPAQLGVAPDGGEVAVVAADTPALADVGPASPPPVKPRKRKPKAVDAPIDTRAELMDGTGVAAAPAVPVAVDGASAVSDPPLRPKKKRRRLKDLGIGPTHSPAHAFITAIPPGAVVDEDGILCSPPYAKKKKKQRVRVSESDLGSPTSPPSATHLDHHPIAALPSNASVAYPRAYGTMGTTALPPATSSYPVYSMYAAAAAASAAAATASYTAYSQMQQQQQYHAAYYGGGGSLLTASPYGTASMATSGASISSVSGGAAAWSSSVSVHPSSGGVAPTSSWNGGGAAAYPPPTAAPLSPLSSSYTAAPYPSPYPPGHHAYTSSSSAYPAYQQQPEPTQHYSSPYGSYPARYAATAAYIAASGHAPPSTAGTYGYYAQVREHRRQQERISEQQQQQQQYGYSGFGAAAAYPPPVAPPPKQQQWSSYQ
ncbi:hypothetical protein H9P43_005959 [Blastocladiella emersonii ATCC 22665]|nr:hypothetical protein H9P43_005959 [Blastocladiella emersonii ATCC 22665]